MTDVPMHFLPASSSKFKFRPFAIFGPFSFRATQDGINWNEQALLDG